MAPLRRASRLAGGFLLLGLVGAGGMPSDTVKFTTRSEGEATVIVGENTSPWMSVHGVVTFPRLENLDPSIPVPARFVIPAATKRDLLTLTRVRRDRATRLNVSYRWGRGDPGAVPDEGFAYLFPYEHGVKHHVDQGYFGPTTHRGMRALDFDLAEGATVCAARDGVVVATRDDSNVGGPGARYEGTANFVEILHSDGTWASYAHFQYHGVLVRPGQAVKAGDPIGRAGHTGQASGPHLHFAVYRANWDAEGGETVPTVFLHVDGKAVPVEEGRTYYSVHPGKPAFDVRLAVRMSDADFEGVTRFASATGTLRVRDEKVDEKVFLWCMNGMDTAQEVTVSFSRLLGLEASKPLPYVRVVPARTEVFLLSLNHAGGGGVAAYEIRYAWRPASPP